MPPLSLPPMHPARKALGLLSPLGWIVRWAPVWVPLLLLWQFSERGLKPALAERSRLQQLAPAVEAGFTDASQAFEILNAEAQAWQDPVYRERLRRIALLGPPEVLLSEADDNAEAFGAPSLSDPSHSGDDDLPWSPYPQGVQENEPGIASFADPLESNFDSNGYEAETYPVESPAERTEESEFVPSMLDVGPPPQEDLGSTPGAGLPWRVE